MTCSLAFQAAAANSYGWMQRSSFLPRRIRFQHSMSNENEPDRMLNNPTEKDSMEEEAFLRSSLARLESLEELLEELEESHDDDMVDWDDQQESLAELLDSLPVMEEGDDDDDDEENDASPMSPDRLRAAETTLERALLQGVVPVSAGVGSECLPGDYGFDPLKLATKDYFLQTQTALLNVLAPTEKEETAVKDRPRALILRDYREAEIRHGRLAMLAAVFWPLQEMLDRLLLDEDLVGPLIYGPVTLPYFPLVMTAIMMLLGYLDIYSQAIKERDYIGEAFLPGDCFWDPLRMLEGAPDRMKRNMQERELLNGRVAMLAVAAYVWEEGKSHVPLIEIPGNELLLEPAYQVPFIQEYLDGQFAAKFVTDAVVSGLFC